jgi:hypothetical protein
VRQGDKLRKRLHKRQADFTETAKTLTPKQQAATRKPGSMRKKGK